MTPLRSNYKIIENRGAFSLASRGKKERRRLFLISITVILLLVSLFGSMYHDFMQIINNHKETIALTAEYERLLEEEKALTSEVTKMQDPNYLARYAKEKYLYSEDNEIIIRID